MKKIILFFSCFYFASAFSQNLTKGDKLFGGSLSFVIINSNNAGPSYYNTGNAGIFPSYAWLVKDNLAFGVRGSVGYSSSVTKYDNGDKRKTRSTVTGLGIFLKKYKTLKDRFGIYFDHEVSGFYNIYKETAPFNTDIKNESYGASYRISPGVFYKFSKRFIGEGNIGGAFLANNAGQGSRNFVPQFHFSNILTWGSTM